MLVSALLLSLPAQAEVLVLKTQSFIVKIDVRCAEGNVTCEYVLYTGTSRRTGKSISVKGHTMHSKCADGVTPCRFQGYTFDNGKINYTVYEDGGLVVMNGDKTLANEKGVWK
ncbi:MAG: hypothetical protein HY253_04215 [Burkholderiales bacterium]|nr:hypothetical protein [Burkholderiales bacterium]